MRCRICGTLHEHYHITDDGIKLYRYCIKHCLLCKLKEDEEYDEDNSNRIE